MIPVFTHKQVWREMVKLAGEFPDRVASCHYRDPKTGETCCIVAHAFDRLGIPVPSHDDRYLNLTFKLEMDSDVYGWAIHWTQVDQDSGYTWGAAVARTESLMGSQVSAK